MNAFFRDPALRISLLYAVIASGWIFFSDRLLALWEASESSWVLMHTYKGWIFVLVTALLLFILLRALRPYVDPPFSSLPTTDHPHPSPKGWVPLLIFMVLAVAIVTTGYILFAIHRQADKKEAHDHLQAIARLKAQHIQQWVNERYGDAATFAVNSFLAREVQLWQTASPDEQAAIAVRIQRRLRAIQQAYGYQALHLFDKEGKFLMSTAEIADPIAPDEARWVLEAIATRQTRLSELHRNTVLPHQPVELGLIAPLQMTRDADDPDEETVVAVLVFKMAAAQFLYPLIQAWPNESRSAETLLVRRDGDHVLFLNPLRFAPEAAFQLRLPLTDTRSPAVRAVLGTTGLTQGVNYRQHDVLAAIEPVTSTAWWIVTQVDSDEVYAPIVRLAWHVLVVAGLFILVAAWATYLWWRGEQSRYLSRYYRSELERQALAQHYDYLTKYANDIVQLVDNDGRIVEVNERCLVAYGYSRDELLGQPASLIEVQETPGVPTLSTLHWEHIDPVNGYLFETYHRRKDGHTFPVEVSVRPIEVHGLRFQQAIIRDITERRQAQAALIQSRDFYITLLDKLPNPVWRAGLDGGCNYFNRSWLEFTGRTFEQEQGTGWTEGVHPDDLGRCLRIYREAFAAKSIFQMEYRLRYHDGSYRWITDYGQPFYDLEGQFAGYIGSCYDIHQERITRSRIQQMADQLTQQAITLRAILDTTPDHIYQLDRDGYCQYASAAGLRDLGLSENAVIAHPINDIGLPSEIAEPFDQKRIAVQKTGFPLKGETTLPTLQGSSDYEYMIAPLINAEGQIQGTVVTLHDITARKRDEELLRRAQKMEAIGQLTGGIAHDFNNLLAVILGNLDMLLSLTSDPLMRDCLYAAIRATERGADLTHRLLAFSRRQPLHPKSVQANELLGNLLNLCRRTLGEAVVIRQHLCPDLWRISVDPGQLENSLLNLAINARDAMPQGGILTFSTANITIGPADLSRYPEATVGDYVRLSVADTGVGMTPQVLERAFEPFFTTKEVGKGSGLGLSMVYGFIKQSGGHIKVTSHVGRGTTVDIYLPRWLGDEAIEPVRTVTPKIMPPPTDCKVILVVEDDADVRLIAVSLLRQHGYEVLEAASGDEALVILAKRPVDLLFTDMVLAGSLNGAQLAAAAYQQHPDLKVLYTTGYAEHDVLEQGPLTKEGILLTKPYRKEQLLMHVRKILQEPSSHSVTTVYS